MHSYSVLTDRSWKERKCDILCTSATFWAPDIAKGFIRDLGWCVHISEMGVLFSVTGIVDPWLEEWMIPHQEQWAYSLLRLLWNPALRAELRLYLQKQAKQVPIASWSPCGRASLAVALLPQEHVCGQVNQLPQRNQKDNTFYIITYLKTVILKKHLNHYRTDKTSCENFVCRL